MKKLNYDIVIIGGGPAGLSAAVEAAKDKSLRILLIERDKNLGGILQQCIHDGFGLFRFGQRLSGTEYAQRYIDFVKEESIDIKLDTMVLEVTKDKNIYAINPEDGMLEISCGAVILAMGCRERTAIKSVYLIATRDLRISGCNFFYLKIKGLCDFLRKRF